MDLRPFSTTRRAFNATVHVEWKLGLFWCSWGGLLPFFGQPSRAPGSLGIWGAGHFGAFTATSITIFALWRFFRMSLAKSLFLLVPEASKWRSTAFLRSIFHRSKSFQRNSARRMETRSFLVLLGWPFAVLWTAFASSWELRNLGRRPFWSFYSHVHYNLCALAFFQDVLSKITVFACPRGLQVEVYSILAQHFPPLEELSTQQCASNGNSVFFGTLGVAFCRSLDSLREFLKA